MIADNLRITQDSLETQKDNHGVYWFNVGSAMCILLVETETE